MKSSRARVPGVRAWCWDKGKSRNRIIVPRPALGFMFRYTYAYAAKFPFALSLNAPTGDFGGERPVLGESLAELRYIRLHLHLGLTPYFRHYGLVLWAIRALALEVRLLHAF